MNIATQQQVHKPSNNTGRYSLPSFIVENDKLQDYTYKSILNSISLFRKTDGLGKTSKLKIFDVPATFYFKIFFYFNDGNLLSDKYDTSLFPENLIINGELPLSGINNISTTNLNYYPNANSWSQFTESPALTGQMGVLSGQTHKKNDEIENLNTAFNYLLINKEYARANKLLKFITLLQDISVNNPWYFKELNGLTQALERKEFSDKEFKIEEERKSIMIKCLPDAYDTRIGTLLDLYKDFTRSYQLHKDILPANLRKFDMGIYIFESPNMLFHKNYNLFTMSDNDMDYMLLNEGNTKFLEFHNCEIDYNSSSSEINTINNEEGLSPEYQITIKFDTVYEQRYNNIFNNIIGDFYKWDLLMDMEDKIYREDYNGNVDKFNFEDKIKKNNTTISSIIHSNIINKNIQLIKKISLGNLYTFQPGKLLNTAEQISQGNVMGAIGSVSQMTRQYNNKNTQPVTKYKNKYNDGWNLGHL